MPPYDFPYDPNWIQETLDRLASRRQQPQAVSGEQQELPTQNSEPQAQSGTDTINQMTAKGLREAGADIPILDPVARREYLPRVLEAKQMYGSAKDPAYQKLLGSTRAEIEAQAMSNANYWRNAAKTANYDLSNYGEGVSLDDAYKNLQTNDARAATELFNGKFSKSADMFYEEKYRQLMSDGFNATDAERIATGLTKQYQGNRVSWLKGMYYGYGTDTDNVMTPLGRDIVNQIALEQPQIANAYLNENPSMKDAYQQSQETARTMINNKARMDELIQTILGNQSLATLNAKLGRETYEANATVDKQNWLDQQLKSIELNNRKFKADIDTIWNVAFKYGGKEFADKVAKLKLGIDDSKGLKDVLEARRDMQKDIINGLNDTLGKIGTQINSLHQKYKDGAEMSSEDYSRLIDLQDAFDATQKQLFGIYNINPDFEFDNYTGNRAEDIKTIRALIALNSSDAEKHKLEFTTKDAINTVRLWAQRSGKNLSDEEIDSLIAEALGVEPPQKKTNVSSNDSPDNRIYPQGNKNPNPYGVGQSNSAYVPYGNAATDAANGLPIIPYNPPVPYYGE